MEAFSAPKYHTSIDKKKKKNKRKSKSLALNSSDLLSNKQDIQKLSSNHYFFCLFYIERKKIYGKQKLLYEHLSILGKAWPHDVPGTYNILLKLDYLLLIYYTEIICVIFIDLVNKDSK